MNIAARIDKFIPPQTRSLLHALGALASKNSYEIYLVGGIVRDVLLGRENLDVDIAVDGDGQAFAELTAAAMNGSIVMHGRFGTSVVILPGKTRVDIATARTEVYSHPGSLPDVSYAPIRYDLKRRDFSINAMAVSLNPADFGELADYYGGRVDLDNGIVRSLYPESFIDDPTRILRAARFEAALGFSLDAETEERLRQAVSGGYLGKVSGARLRKEVFAIAEGLKPAAALKRLGDLGVWRSMVPGMMPENPAYQAIRELDRAENALRADLKPGYKRRFAIITALLMDSGPDAAAAFCCIIDISRFRASRIIDFAAGSADVAVRVAHEKFPSALYTLLKGLSEESLTVLWASGNKSGRQGVERFLQYRKVKPLITGRDLIRWGYPPSQAYAGVLNDVFTKQLDGTVKTKADAKAEAKKGIVEYNKPA